MGLFSNVVILLSNIWQWLQKKRLHGLSRSFITWFVLYISRKSKFFVLVICRKLCDMGFYVDFEALKLYIFLFCVKFHFQWYVIWLLLKKKFFWILFFGPKNSCCTTSPVSQGYQSGIHFIWCLRTLLKIFVQ